MNVWHDEDRWYVEADLPGLSLHDLEITIQDNQLTIQGERKRPKEDDGTWYRCERGYGRFRRTFEFPEDVDSENAEARLKNGVLVVELPKQEVVKPRRVEIKSN